MEHVGAGFEHIHPFQVRRPRDAQVNEGAPCLELEWYWGPSTVMDDKIETVWRVRKREAERTKFGDIYCAIWIGFGGKVYASDGEECGDYAYLVLKASVVGRDYEKVIREVDVFRALSITMFARRVNR